MYTKISKSIQKISAKQWDILFVIAACALFFALTAHDDLLETSNHAWLFLECIKNGQPFAFYNVVMAHENTLYYLNNAHYNILCYALFALWQLPVYLFHLLTNTAMNEFFLLFYTKALLTIAFGICSTLMYKLARGQGHAEQDAHHSALLFALHPISFFTCIIMGQYDILCLLLLLLALLFWQKNQLWKFSLCMGVAMLFKFFPIFLLLPLLVLAEKRPLRCIGYGLASLWLILPTTLLFTGRAGDMAVFNEEMIARIFAATIDGGIDPLPIFLVCYAIFLLGCYFYRPRTQAAQIALLPWIGLCVFGLFFVFVLWHPQWLILLVPFLILTLLAQNQRAPWLYLQVVLFAGIFLLMNYNFPGALEANLLHYGWLGTLCAAMQAGANNLCFYLLLIPYSVELAPVLFAAPIFAVILFTFPYQGHSLGDRLAGKDSPLAPAPSVRLCAYGIFLCCIGFWFATALFVVCKGL